MKRLLALFLLLTILLSVCGCHPSETLNTPPALDPSGSTEHSQPEDPAETTGASQTKDPTETTGASQPEEPTESTPEPVDYNDLIGFISNGQQQLAGIGIELDLSKSWSGHYYFYNKKTEELTDVFGFKVRHVFRCEIGSDYCLYYVKMAQPNVIYLYNLTQNTHTLCYKSEVGAITYLMAKYESEHILNFVVNQKQFIELDTTTGEKETLLEMFYITKASWQSTVGIGDKVYNNTIYWVGMLDEDDELDEYLYLTETGEMIEWPYL